MQLKHENPSPSEFMRARRPQLFSDTVRTEISEMDQRQFEFHLHTLTSRKEEIAFENFARALAERELCPNLLPQTGPTGGGDSKVDTETYPVAPEIAVHWYEGDQAGAAERWGFAMSAKAVWKPKVESDVAKIVETGRSYTLIYFISNQAIRDKAKADTEDALTKKHGVQVRILDRTWIVNRVVKHKRWDLVAETLQFELSHRVVPSPGPLDTGRLRDLEALDKKIEDAAASIVTLGIVEESLQSALLARGLERPRLEVDGRFERAERLARSIGSSRHWQRVWYQRAWTALWWFNDHDETVRLYDMLAAEVLPSEWIWDIEDLVNLWLALHTSKPLGDVRTAALRAALQRHADDTNKQTSSLWAMTQLSFMDLVLGISSKGDVEPMLKALRQVLGEVRRQIEFPLEPLVRVVRELADVVGDSPGYDELLDTVIEIERERYGDRAAGELHLERGLQKLTRRKSYDAIDDLAKAQFLLALDESRDEFIAALCGTGLAYESAGLLYAARANLVSALDRCLYSWFKEKAVDARALPVIRKLVWLELQLGRVPYVLSWLALLNPIHVALSLNAAKTRELEEEVQAMDRVLGILLLRTPYEQWSSLTRLPDLLAKFGLEMSRAAALFMLGHEEKFKAEYGTYAEDLNDFASQWLAAPAGEDLPKQAVWNFGTTVMTTAILGCQIDVIARSGLTSALLGEAIIGFLEAFYSTGGRSTRLFSPRSNLVIEVRQSEGVKPPFAHRHVEDECGETKLVITHPIATAADLISKDFEGPMMKLFARIAFELQIGIEQKEFEEMFASHRALDRAHHVARSIISVTNILSESPRGRAEDWVQDETLPEYPLVRNAAWVPTVATSQQPSATSQNDVTIEVGPPPDRLFGADAVKHRDMAVMSPINIPLWNRAGWKGVGVALPGASGEVAPPTMALVFEDIDTGQKIFRGWHKKVGTSDVEGFIGVTVITGIKRVSPLDYRVAIGISEPYMRAMMAGKRQFAMVYRMHDMTPSSGRNLELLQEHFRRAGFVILIPMPFKADEPGILMRSGDFAFGIKLRDLNFIPAWQVGADSTLLAAMGGIDDPIVPEGVTDIPFVQALERIREMKAGRSK